MTDVRYDLEHRPELPNRLFNKTVKAAAIQARATYFQIFESLDDELPGTLSAVIAYLAARASPTLLEEPKGQAFTGTPEVAAPGPNTGL